MLLSQSCAAVIYSMLNMAASEPNLATCDHFSLPDRLLANIIFLQVRKVTKHTVLAAHNTLHTPEA